MFNLKISFIYLFRETISAGFFQFYFPLQDVQQSSAPGFKKLQLAPPARIPLCKYSSFKEIPQNWVAMDQQVSPDTMVRELWKNTFLKLHQVLATVIQKPSNLEKLFFSKWEYVLTPDDTVKKVNFFYNAKHK